jgi:hypothetical protein
MGPCAATAFQAVGTLGNVTGALFGLDNAGKTCLMMSLAGDFRFNPVRIVGFSHDTFLVSDIRLLSPMSGASTASEMFGTDSLPKSVGSFTPSMRATPGLSAEVRCTQSDDQ